MLDGAADVRGRISNAKRKIANDKGSGLIDGGREADRRC